MCVILNPWLRLIRTIICLCPSNRFWWFLAIQNISHKSCLKLLVNIKSNKINLCFLPFNMIFINIQSRCIEGGYINCQVKMSFLYVWWHKGTVKICCTWQGYTQVNASSYANVLPAQQLEYLFSAWFLHFQKIHLILLL